MRPEIAAEVITTGGAALLAGAALGLVLWVLTELNPKGGDEG